MTHKIFDSTFKKILTLSSKAVVNMINGLFYTSYDPDTAEVFYHWTESVKDDTIKTTLADTILVINNSDAYHMEAQMTKDENIVFRVFSYGAGYADKTKEISQDEKGHDIYQIHFPNPCIIYLNNVSESVPDTYSLSVDLGLDAPIIYRVPVVKLMNCSTEDINNRKMVILVPFFLLKLRERLSDKESRTPENIASLKSLIKTDIMGSIDKNIELGNITLEDGAQLYKLTQVLYTKLYSYYEETESQCLCTEGAYRNSTDDLPLSVARGRHNKEVTDMVDQSIVTFVDEFQEQKAKLEHEIAERDKELAYRDKELADRDKKLAAQKEESDAIIARLQAEIAELKKSQK